MVNSPVLTRWQEQALALAGLVQAVELVDKLATTGFANTPHMETCIASLFVRNPPNTLSVYGDLTKILPGLERLQHLLISHNQAQDANRMRYALGVLYLQKKLSRNSAMLSTIGQRLEKAEQQAQLFGLTQDNVIANLAEIYTSTISTFDFRIQVSGDTHHLQQNRIASQIRALLLAAIRSAMLWRQLGGHRWHLLIYRQRLTQATADLVKQAKTDWLQ